MIIEVWRHLLTLFVTLLLAWPSLAGGAVIRLAAADTHNPLPAPEALLAKTLQEIRAGRLDVALNDVNELISMRPDFRLAHLIRGDLLLARTRPLSTLGEAPGASQASLTDLRDEARVRLLRYLDQPKEGSLPIQVLQLAPRHKYALLADAKRARLYVFENIEGVPHLVRDYYLTIGRNGANKQVEGDKKTPVGVYTISQYLPRQQLADIYGAGAYPLDYPNEWDRLHGRSGSGIWIHGTPSNTYSRPPRASDGCLVLANPDLIDLGQYIEVGKTPIMIVDRTEWVDPKTWETKRQEILTVLDQWRRDWEARKVSRFLRHYVPETLNKTWVANKRRNIENKAWIRVGLSDISIFLYPNARLAVTTFTQNYSSDSFSDSTLKRLYWRLDGSQWRIALEQSLPTNTQLAARGR